MVSLEDLRHIPRGDLERIIVDVCEVSAVVRARVRQHVRILIERETDVARERVEGTPSARGSPSNDRRHVEFDDDGADAPLTRSDFRTPSREGAGGRERRRPRSSTGRPASATSSRRSRRSSRPSTATPVSSRRSGRRSVGGSGRSSALSGSLRTPRKAMRVTAYRNGTNTKSVKVAAHSIEQLLRLAAEKLSLAQEPKRVFDSSGQEAKTMDDLWTDAKVYISCGERFRDPFGDPVPWTRVDDQGAHTTARDYKHPITKSDQNVRVQAVRNGDAYAVSAIVVAETGTARKEGTFNMDDAMRKLLADATAKLRLPSAAAIAYNEVGEEITSTRDLTKDQVVYISCGEPFRDPYDTMPWREEHKKSNVRFRADDPKLANALNVRVLARENGVRGAATVPVLAHTGSMFDQAQGMQMLLAECTGKLGLSRAARYIFHENGKKVESTHDLEKEEIVYVSTGEPFLDPEGAIEDWIAVKTRGHAPPTSADDLLARHRVRLLKARVNGQPRPEAIITAHLEGVYSAEQAWELMLEDATRKLGLTRAARRVFLEDGTEVTKTDTFEENNVVVYVSTGAAFRDPNGDPLPWRDTPSKRASDRHMVTPKTARVRCLANGWGGMAASGAAVVTGTSIKDLLRQASATLGLNKPARVLYDDRGERVVSFEELCANKDMVVYVSSGEPFDPALVGGGDGGGPLMASSRAVVERTGGPTVVGVAGSSSPASSANRRSHKDTVSPDRPAAAPGPRASGGGRERTSSKKTAAASPSPSPERPLTRAGNRPKSRGGRASGGGAAFGGGLGSNAHLLDS